MNWRALGVAAAMVAALVGGTACTDMVAGAALRAVGSGDDTGQGYGYAQDRCGLLLDSTVARVLGAQKVVRPYSGAVCQYVMSRRNTMVDVTYSWFETGTLGRERAVAQDNHAQVWNVVVQHHDAFLARRSVTGNACSATAATTPGVVTWWVQVRGDAAADPCRDAQNLLTKTLSSDL